MLSDQVDLACDVVQRVLRDVFGSENTEDLSLGALVRSVLLDTGHSLPPDIAKITIASSCPFRGTGVLDVQTGLKRHAMGGRLATVDGGLARLSNGGTLRLSNKEHRVGIGVCSSRELVGNEADKGSDDDGAVDVPLGKEIRDALVEGQQQIVEGTHDDRRELRGRSVRGNSRVCRVLSCCISR